MVTRMKCVCTANGKLRNGVANVLKGFFLHPIQEPPEPVKMFDLWFSLSVKKFRGKLYTSFQTVSLDARARCEKEVLNLPV